MFKVFYNLPNDLIDRKNGNFGLLDILQFGKHNVLTELGQLKGEKIDMIYMMQDEKLLSQVGELQVKKISVFSKGDDDIVIPKNFVKFS